MMLPITFTDEDFHALDPDQDYPMVITVEFARYGVSKVLIDQAVQSVYFIGKHSNIWTF